MKLNKRELLKVERTIKRRERLLKKERIEADLEWIIEGIGEGYTKKQLAKQYGVTVRTLTKIIRNETN